MNINRTIKVYITVMIILALTIYLAGCSVGARLERGMIVQPTYQTSIPNFQQESFIQLVLFIRHHHDKKPTDDLILTAKTHMYNSGFTRQCRNNECFFVHYNKEVVITTEYVQIRFLGSQDYTKYYDMEEAMRKIYES